MNGTTYNITSYALNTQQAEVGLMNTTVTNSTFMLFVFPKPGNYTFWMKNTYSQLDIIWIYAKGNTDVVTNVANASPCISYDPNQTNCIVYSPSGAANYVIETSAGFIERNGIKAGSAILFNK